MKFTDRVKRFLVIGFSAAIVNLMLMILFVEVFKFNTYLLRNIANILSIEISIAYNFSLSRLWTWKDAPKKQGKRLIMQFIAFNLAALTGISIRAVTFAFLDLLGVFYILNVIIGIGLAATVDFILYDKLIFKRREDEKQCL